MRELRSALALDDMAAIKEDLVVMRVHVQKATQRADSIEAERAMSERSRSAAEARARELEGEVAELAGRLHGALERERRAAEKLEACVPDLLAS